MHITVDARYINITTSEEAQHTLALLCSLIQSYSEHHFTIIVLQTGLLPVLPNVTEHIVTTNPTSFLQIQRWYGKTLPALLAQNKASAFIGINSSTAKMDIPQLIFLSSLTAVQQSFTGKFLLPIYKKYLNKKLVKADVLATFTNLQQLFIAKQTGVEADLVVPIGYAVPSVFAPASWQQKELLLEEYTNGSEYFLYTGSFSEATFLLVLKAFSLFKKRQLSSMQLIIAGVFKTGKDLTEKLATYKYRSAVKLYESADQQTMALLTSAAYVIIHLDEKGLAAYPAAAALQCGVPIIGLESSAVKDIAKSAALYTLPTSEDLAEQMKRLYKDEALRQQLIVNAATQMPLVNSNAAAQKLWKCIEMATTKFRLHLPPEKRP